MALWYECGNGLIKTSLARKDLGADAYLCCPGPSLAAVDPALFQQPGLMVFAVNTAYPKIRPHVWLGLDVPVCYDPRLWWEPFVKITRMHTVGGIDMTRSGGQHVRYAPNVYFADLEAADPAQMFSRRAHDVRFVWDKNTLIFTLHVMIWMGARRIRLVGCDFGGVDGGPDYHDSRVLSPERRESNRRLYRQQVETLGRLRPLAEAAGIEIVSCTPGSPAGAFLPEKGLAEAVEESARRVPRAAARLLHALDAQLCQWRPATVEEGVVVGCAPSQEWMLEWWWDGYAVSNDLPVVFADFGLSDAARQWCAERGTILPVADAPVHGWLRKPFAILRAPFRRLLWVDLDVEVRSDLRRLLAYLDRGPVALQVGTGPVLVHDRSEWNRTMPEGAPYYCTSVVAVRHGEPLIAEWATAVLDPLPRYEGDHEALSHLIQLRSQPVEVFRTDDCVTRIDRPGVAAVHWGGWAGKQMLRRRIERRARLDVRCRWRETGVLDLAGVLVGCDEHQEWLLEWWWERYRRSNGAPVLFADFGMSPQARRWCGAHGLLLEVAERFEDASAPNPLATTFCKPFALLASHFRYTVLMDLDCEVRGDLAPLFDLARQGCSLRDDRFAPEADSRSPVQSGVIAVRHGHPLIPAYAQHVLRRWRELHSDQSSLNAVVDDFRSEVTPMPPECHWLRLEGENPAALVFHWTGPQGKTQIRRTLVPAAEAQAAG